MLFSLVVLTACSGTKPDDTAPADDTAADTGDTGTEVEPINFEFTFRDGITGGALVGAEICVEEPIVDDNCYTSDADGLAAWTWEQPEPTNFAARLTLEQYVTTVYAGRYAEDVAEAWEDQIEETGVVALNYGAFKTASVGAFLATGGVTQNDGKGLVLFSVWDGAGSGIDGVVISLSDDSGNDVGTVHYANPFSSAVDTTLEATSSSGTVAIANVEPGTHTLTAASPDHTCQAGFSWASDEDNTIPVPVEADVMTMSNMVCTPN